jgi:Holliday junction DNA helicase RuvA
MYEYIKGKLTGKSDEYIVIDVMGIGYKLHTSLGTISAIGNTGDDVKVYTYLHVREDVLDLYGFKSQDELNMFKMLLGVSGVGPKASLSLVSTVGPSSFGLAIITDDFNTLTKAAGIGKKGAQRIVLELKDKLKKEQIKTGKDFFSESAPLDSANNNVEAINALQVLGYSAYEASNAIKKVAEKDMSVEEIIKKALNIIGENILR